MKLEFESRRLKLNCQDMGCPRMALYEVIRSDGWRIWYCQKHLDNLKEKTHEQDGTNGLLHFQG